MIYDPKKELDETRARVKLDSLIDKGKPFELTDKSSTYKFLTEEEKTEKERSKQTNRYLHAVIDLIACVEGYPRDRMKIILKQRCSFMHDLIDGYRVPKTTVTGQKEINDFIEWIRNHAQTELGEYIPSAEEYLENQFHIDREISRNREFL